MIELAIPDETPQAALSEADILDCFLATPMSGSYRQYVVGAGRAIEAKLLADCVQPGEPTVAMANAAQDVLNRRHAIPRVDVLHALRAALAAKAAA